MTKTFLKALSDSASLVRNIVIGCKFRWVLGRLMPGTDHLEPRGDFSEASQEAGMFFML